MPECSALGHGPDEEGGGLLTARCSPPSLRANWPLGALRLLAPVGTFPAVDTHAATASPAVVPPPTAPTNIAHDFLALRPRLSGVHTRPRPCGCGRGPWCGARRAPPAPGLCHAVPEHAGHGRCDGRALIGRAVAGRNPGRRGRSDRGRRQPGRDRGARPFARRRPFAFDPARTTLRAGATRRGPLGRAQYKA